MVSKASNLLSKKQTYNHQKRVSIFNPCRNPISFGFQPACHELKCTLNSTVPPRHHHHPTKWPQPTDPHAQTLASKREVKILPYLQCPKKKETRSDANTAIYPSLIMWQFHPINRLFSETNPFYITKKADPFLCAKCALSPSFSFFLRNHIFWDRLCPSRTIATLGKKKRDKLMATKTTYNLSFYSKKWVSHKIPAFARSGEHHMMQPYLMCREAVFMFWTCDTRVTME